MKICAVTLERLRNGEVRTVQKIGTLDNPDIIFILIELDSFVGIEEINKFIEEFDTFVFLIVPFSLSNSNINSNLILNSIEANKKVLKKQRNSIIVMSNKVKLLNYDQSINDKVLQIINGISNILLLKTEDDISIDIYDLQSIITGGRKIVYVGIGESKSEGPVLKVIKYAIKLFGIARETSESKSEGSVLKAIKYAIKSSGIARETLHEVKGVLVHLKVHPSFPIMNMADAMDIVSDSVHEDAEVIFGTSTDESMTEDNVKATIIFTNYMARTFVDFI